MREHFQFYIVLFISVFSFHSIACIIPNTDEQVNKSIYVDKNKQDINRNKQNSFVTYTNKNDLENVPPSHKDGLEPSVCGTFYYSSPVKWEIQILESKWKYKHFLVNLDYAFFRANYPKYAHKGVYLDINFYDSVDKNFIGIGLGNISIIGLYILKGMHYSAIPVVLCGFAVTDKVFIKFNTKLSLPTLGDFNAVTVIVNPIENLSMKSEFVAYNINKASVLTGDYKFKFFKNIYGLISTGLCFYNETYIENRLFNICGIFGMTVGYDFNSIRF